MFWKLRYAWAMARCLRTYRPDNLRWFWRSACAAYPEGHAEMTPYDAMLADIEAWQ